jgi:AcrR family transcriptional regulator
MTEYSGRGDAQRSMELLWGPHREPSRGPRPGLTVETIVRAAIDIADADGLTGLSMRRVAAALDAGTMSLYTYVPGKAELLDVMLDTVIGELPLPLPADQGWRAALEARARQDWALFERHPWVLRISPARAVLGPNEVAVFDASLQAVAGLPLRGRDMVAVISTLADYVRGAAQRAIEAGQAPQRTGISDDQWWLARAPLLEKVIDARRFPAVASMDAAGGFDQPVSDAGYTEQQALDDFEFGLQRVLDGIAVLVGERSAAPRP